jgi:lipopolysaccharide heptosyltransferase II
VKPDNKSIRKLLIITPSGLGDAVLTLPVFQSLQEALPDAQLHVVAGKREACIFDGDPRIGKLTVYDNKQSLLRKMVFLSRIREEHYDLIVDLKYSLIGLLGGARFHNDYGGFVRAGGHRALEHPQVLGDSAPAAAQTRSFLMPDPEAAGSVLEKIERLVSPHGFAADEFLHGGRLVVAAVGARSDIKKWPADHYAKLLDRLIRVNQCHVVLTGEASDIASALEVRRGMTSFAVDLTGKTNFRELCSVLASAALLITNDTAPLYIADSLKTPCLAIFGPTDLKKYGPHFGHSHAVSRNIFCSPCERTQCRYNHECMTELGVDQVYKKALEILRGKFLPPNLKVLVIRLDRIGDMVMSFPALEAIRERFPDAQISLMVRPYTQAIGERCSVVDEVIPYCSEKKGRHRSLLGYVRFIHEIVKRRFDVAFVFHPDVRAHLVPLLAGIPRRVGMDKHASFLLTRRIPDLRRNGLKHDSEYALDVVRAVGIEPARRTGSLLATFPEDGVQVERFLSKAGWHTDDAILALHPGASCHTKRWPREHFRELACLLVAHTRYRVVVVGGEDEVAFGEYLSNHTEGKLLDLTGKLTLEELMFLLKKSDLLVSNDSGPVHVAAAVGTRVLCLFGRKQAGFNARRWKPLGEGHRVVQKNVGCVVCVAHACTIDFECLKSLKAGEVLGEIELMGIKK